MFFVNATPETWVVRSKKLDGRNTRHLTRRTADGMGAITKNLALDPHQVRFRPTPERYNMKVPPEGKDFSTNEGRAPTPQHHKSSKHQGEEDLGVPPNSVATGATRTTSTKSGGILSSGGSGSAVVVQLGLGYYCAGSIRKAIQWHGRVYVPVGGETFLLGEGRF
jgi:hypothetical protein